MSKELKMKNEMKAGMKIRQIKEKVKDQDLRRRVITGVIRNRMWLDGT